MSVTSTLNYELTLQNVASDDTVGIQAVVDVSIPLPNAIASSDIVTIATSTVDQALNMASASGVDLVMLQSLDNSFTFKLNSTAGTSITVRELGMAFMDSQNISAVYVSNGGSSPATFRFIQARQQVLP